MLRRMVQVLEPATPRCPLLGFEEGQQVFVELLLVRAHSVPPFVRKHSALLFSLCDTL
jgi:hypothetical protein